jgi:hypothetical protein
MVNKLKRFTKIAGLLAFGVAAHADSPVPPYPKATASGGGTAVFIMVPKTEDARASWADGTGTMYLLGETGTLEKQWEVSGWYSHHVFLTNDGDYLVRIGPWHSGHEPKKDHLALAFFKRGRLIRSYSTKDLIRDPKQVRQSVSHYEWRADDAPYIGMGEFSITTVEGRFLVFDLESGDIKRVRTRPETKG